MKDAEAAAKRRLAVACDVPGKSETGRDIGERWVLEPRVAERDVLERSPLDEIDVAAEIRDAPLLLVRNRDELVPHSGVDGEPGRQLDVVLQVEPDDVLRELPEG